MDLTKRNSGLDLIRATAILLVLVGHFELISDTSMNYSFYKMGFYGVELFFVLSGFLIGQILIKTYQKGLNLSVIKTFWYRRWLRTLPLFLLIIVVRELFFNSSGQFHYLHFFFLQMSIKPLDYDTMWFGESWSLAVEEWFYLFVPFIFLVFSVFKFKRKQVITIFLFFFVGFVIVRFLYLTRSTLLPDYDTEIRKFTFLRLDSICIGVFLAYLKINFEDFYKLMSRKVVFIGALLIFLSLNFVGNILVYDFVGEKLIPSTIGFSLLSFLLVMLIPFLENLKWNSKTKLGLLIRPIVLYTSIFSYSIYLIHIPIYQSVVSNLHFFSLAWWIQVILAIVIIYLLAYLLYFFFELPILKWRDRITTQNEKND